MYIYDVLIPAVVLLQVRAASCKSTVGSLLRLVRAASPAKAVVISVVSLVCRQLPGWVF